MELCAEYSDDIPNLPDREDRYTEVMVDCYNVLALSSRGDERKGLLFEAKVRGRKRLVPAHEVYPAEQKGRNATVLGDYREWWPGSLHDDEWQMPVSLGASQRV